MGHRLRRGTGASYLLKTRRSGPIYRYELTEAQHVELLGVITRLPCNVAISGYWSPLYAEALLIAQHDIGVRYHVEFGLVPANAVAAGRQASIVAGRVRRTARCPVPQLE